MVKNAFLLMIHLEFHNEEERDAWISLFRPLAEYCLQNEPGTLGYDVAIADSNPLKVLVYERYAMWCVFGAQPSPYLTSPRYASKADHTAHTQSAPYLEFKEQASSIPFAAKSGQSYIEQNIGFIRA